MKKKYYIWGALMVCSVLTGSLVRPVNTLATVPGTNEAIDISAAGGDPNGNATPYGMSQDGRYIVYASTATNLVSPATNGHSQVYVKDRLNNTTTLISISSAGSEGNADSSNPRISADGRYVVFQSDATNLVSGDTNGTADIFVHDMSSDTTSLVSANISGAEGNNWSGDPDVNSDGGYVVFDSYATNLVSSPSVSNKNIYEKNMLTGEVKLLSQSPAGQDENQASNFPRISCEGRFVVFESTATNLVPGDPNTHTNLFRIYIVDMLKPIAPLYIMALPNNSGMGNPSISCNGNYVAFPSDASNIVPNDTNGQEDAFVYDRINNTFDRVSGASDGTQGNGYVVGGLDVSNDGKYVVFSSTSTNLVSEGDTNGAADVFLHNRQTGVTELISRNASDVISDGYSASGFISSDGRYVTYNSSADNLVDNFSSSLGAAVYASQTGASDDY